MTSTCPFDLYDTLGTGSGAGRSASASKAAIFGVAAPPSADQPAVSRMLTNLSSLFAPALSFSSAKSGASCVQATMHSPPPAIAAPNSPTSRRQSSVWIVSGAPDCSAAASALASSAMVRLQLQTFSVFPSSAMSGRVGFRGNGKAHLGVDPSSDGSPVGGAASGIAAIWAGSSAAGSPGVSAFFSSSNSPSVRAWFSARSIAAGMGSSLV